MSAPDEQSVEAGNAGPCNRAGVGIVQVVIVDEVVGGDLAQAVVAVDAHGTLVVADGLRSKAASRTGS